MKFSSVLILGLAVFVASCSAQCNCTPTDQPCMDKCVMAANSCIVKCETSRGDSCQQACIASNWPSMPASQKDVLAAATSTSGLMTASPTGSTMPTAMSSMSDYVSTYSTTLSGGSAVLITTTIHPSASNYPRPSGATSGKVDLNNSTSDASPKQVLGVVTLASLLTSAAWFF